MNEVQTVAKRRPETHSPTTLISPLAHLDESKWIKVDQSGSNPLKAKKIGAYSSHVSHSGLALAKFLRHTSAHRRGHPGHQCLTRLVLRTEPNFSKKSSSR